MHFIDSSRDYCSLILTYSAILKTIGTGEKKRASPRLDPFNSVLITVGAANEEPIHKKY